MAERLLDDNGIGSFIDDNGITFFVDDNGNYIGDPPPGRRKYFSMNFTPPFWIVVAAGAISLGAVTLL